MHSRKHYFPSFFLENLCMLNGQKEVRVHVFVCTDIDREW